MTVSGPEGPKNFPVHGGSLPFLASLPESSQKLGSLPFMVRLLSFLSLPFPLLVLFSNSDPQEEKKYVMTQTLKELEVALFQDHLLGYDFCIVSIFLFQKI
jgi:hypothetical protein